MISAALLVLAVVVTGPVSLCLRGRWRAVRLGAFLVTYLALEVTALAGAWRSGSGAARPGGAMPSAIRA
jgi:hypothetical protein